MSAQVAGAKAMSGDSPKSSRPPSSDPEGPSYRDLLRDQRVVRKGAGEEPLLSPGASSPGALLDTADNVRQGSTPLTIPTSNRPSPGPDSND